MQILMMMRYANIKLMMKKILGAKNDINSALNMTIKKNVITLLNMTDTNVFINPQSVKNIIQMDIAL